MIGGGRGERPLKCAQVNTGSVPCFSITGFLNRMMNKLIKDGMITRTLPDKPMSRLQKYRITPAGLAELMRFREQ
jgi:hypothetical protein